MRFILRLGRKRRGVLAVTCRPTPPFFFAIPRRWMTWPLAALVPVMQHCLDIVSPVRKERGTMRGFCTPVKAKLSSGGVATGSCLQLSAFAPIYFKAHLYSCTDDVES